ncbi:MAG: potassium-transporting ATPase subunit F [Anaerolineae bacterium]|nr:potassium-transporting ATPase subunit F [Anaerolineae bacterium]
MAILYGIAGFIAIALLVYLLVMLVRGEKF